MSRSAHAKPLVGVYVSFADCEPCGRIPQKIEISLDRYGVPPDNPAVDRLTTAVSVHDANVHAYASNSNMLLKCPTCGTYYFYNRYTDEGEHFMDPTSNDIVVRRYDPLSALEFLERIVTGRTDALPVPTGQLSKAFLEDGDAPTTRIAEGELAAQNARARRELDELQARYPGLIRDLRAILRRRGGDWQIRTHAITGLCYHLAVEGDWPGLSRLLHHRDPVSRLTAALLVTAIGLGDQATTDFFHTSRRVRAFLKTELAKRARMNEVVNVLLDLAVSAKGKTLEYNSGVSLSYYQPRSICGAALYGLAVAASHRANLLAAIPALLTVCLTHPAEISNVCWVLKNLLEKRRTAPRLIRAAFNQFPPARQAQLRENKSVQELLAACTQRLKPN